VFVLIIFLHESFVAIEKEIEPVDESMIGGICKVVASVLLPLSCYHYKAKVKS
jgi:hypothetical protein